MLPIIGWNASKEKGFCGEEIVESGASFLAPRVAINRCVESWGLGGGVVEWLVG